MCTRSIVCRCVRERERVENKHQVRTNATGLKVVTEYSSQSSLGLLLGPNTFIDHLPINIICFSIKKKKYTNIFYYICFNVMSCELFTVFINNILIIINSKHKRMYVCVIMYKFMI